MTKTRKCLAFVLALVMAMSLICIPGLAYEGPDYDKKAVYGIENYVAFGDSVASGMNNEVRPLYEKVGVDEEGNDILVEILGSTDYGYVGRVADRMGLDLHGNGAVSFSHTGMRVKDVLNEIKEGAVDYAADEDLIYPYVFKTNGYEARREEIREAIKNADLITLNVGSNDIFTGPLTYAAYEYQARVDAGEDLASQGIIGKINKLLPSLSDLTADTTSEMGIFGTLLSPEASGFLEIFLPKCFEGYAKLKETYPQVLAELRELNPTAQIITIGVFNPAHAMNIIGGDVITFGKIADNILLPLNSFIARTSAKYGCTYVDAVDVETDSSVHPTDAGYDDMTNRITAKIHPTVEFKDIAFQSTEFQKSIQWAALTGITNGTSECTFSPDKVCTRAEILTYLWRLAGQPAAEQGENFIDVNDCDYFAEAVAWAAEKGITTGTTALTFTPHALCTRAQIVTFLYRYEQATNPEFKEPDAFSGFNDIGLTAYYGAPVKWAVANGITKGITTQLFGPLQPCTRAQAVTFLARYVGV